MAINFNIDAIALQPPNIPHTIRPVRLSDNDALSQDCWSQRSFTRNQEHLKLVDNAIKRQGGLGIVVETQNCKKIIAYGQILMLSKCSEISDLIVSETCRSQGIGTAMIQYLVRYFRSKHTKPIEIGVAASNPRALALYQRLGFKIAYHLNLNVGKGNEKIIYLNLATV